MCLICPVPTSSIFCVQTDGLQFERIKHFFVEIESSHSDFPDCFKVFSGTTKRLEFDMQSMKTA